MYPFPMCGRYGRRADKQRIAEWFHTRDTNVFDESTFAPSYNVAPQTFQPVVRLNPENNEREIAVMRWSLVPFWAKDAKLAYSTVNAKAETVATNAMYREALKSRRCLVPADFFYEWQKIDAKTKQPYAIGMRDGGLFAFAGLWDRWKDKATGTLLETFTVITTDPNEILESIHNRMPVILQPADYARWLSPGDPRQPPIDLLRPYPAERMKAWKVSQEVGNVRNNDPSLCEEILAPESLPQPPTGAPPPQTGNAKSSKVKAGPTKTNPAKTPPAQGSLF
jgi:putative SOS response-associated peptidase YedK